MVRCLEAVFTRIFTAAIAGESDKFIKWVGTRGDGGKKLGNVTRQNRSSYITLDITNKVAIGRRGVTCDRHSHTGKWEAENNHIGNITFVLPSSFPSC